MIKRKIKIIIIVGARPNFIKVAPLLEEFKKYKNIEPVLIHTGQHYDFEMSRLFFDELKIPKPNYNLEVGSKSHARQTAEIMRKSEQIILKEKPDLVIVVGDVNSTLAGALVAAKLNISLVHIEAGLRSYDKTMPEEINRFLTDHISNYLFCPTKNAVGNLKKEGIVKKVYNTGDIMYDIFLKGIKAAGKKSKILEKIGLKPKNYYLATVHRAASTDSRKNLGEIMAAFCGIGNLIFSCHPRTEKKLKEYNLWAKIKNKIKIIKPVGYIDMLWLEKNAQKILTDSGGMQKEAYFLKIPCITLRKSTEWQETIADGWNVLVGHDKKKIFKAINSLKLGKNHHKYYGDGKSAEKIIRILMNAIKNYE